MSILRFFAGSIQAMDETLARRYAKHVLNPVYRILDEGGELAVVKDGDEGLGMSAPSPDDEVMFGVMPSAKCIRKHTERH